MIIDLIMHHSDFLIECSGHSAPEAEQARAAGGMIPVTRTTTRTDPACLSRAKGWQRPGPLTTIHRTPMPGFPGWDGLEEGN